MKRFGEVWSLAGLAIGVVVIAGAHAWDGGRLALFLQPVALLVVFGGTCAALLVSFPGAVLRRTASSTADVLSRPAEPLESLVPAFIGYAQRVRKRGVMALEDEIGGARDPFLARALTLVVTGIPGDFVRRTLDLDARVCAECDEARAGVLEAAAGYAPTFGVIGAVLGLMHAMSRMSSPADIGTGIAAAFVATVYGVGLANIVFLPLATRLRARAHLEALRRELTIDGILALRDGLHPKLMQERLAGYLHATGVGAKLGRIA